jgi:hypothetical protein
VPIRIGLQQTWQSSKHSWLPAEQSTVISVGLPDPGAAQDYVMQQLRHRIGRPGTSMAMGSAAVPQASMRPMMAADP